MTARLCKLEAATDGHSILEGYDRAKDKWSFSFDGPFWKAVEHAHSLGRKGAGATVAIIDTACDLSIPVLKERVTLNRCVPRPLPSENTEHGTAVALLIAKVAPECRFIMYSVQRADGTIDATDVAHAVGQSAESEAEILNLSLGCPQIVRDLDEKLQHASQDAIDACLYGPSPQHGRCVLLNEILPDLDCALCEKTSAVASTGKLVIAAAGNDESEVLCPARAEGVFAAGFQAKAKRIVLPGPDGGREVRTTGAPGGAQSVFVDLPLEEVSGVLGTSFASPLYAGLGALGVTSAEFSCYLSAIPMTFEAITEHTAIKTEVGEIGHYTPQMTAPLQRVSNLYFNALRRLPHVHSELEFKKRGSPANVTITDPSSCVACGFLAYPLYLNFGLFLLEASGLSPQQHNYLYDAKVLLEVARAIAPWSDAAAADLGRTLEELWDLEEALKLYNTALNLAPGIQPYQESQERIKTKLRNRHTLL